MYNVTPHGTTGKSPSELLFNRRIRDKIPCLDDLSTETMDEETLDHDLMKKEKGKRQTDKARASKEWIINTGDQVIVQNTNFSHKLIPTFDDTEYDVLKRDGNELTLYGNGKIIKRNIAHVKKIIPKNSDDPDEEPETLPPPLKPLKLVRKGGMWESVPR